MGSDPKASELQVPAELSAIAFGEILKSLDTPFLVFGRDGELVYANDAAAHLVGFASAREYLAVPFAESMARLEYFDESMAPLSVDNLPGSLARAGRPGPARMVGHRLKGSGPLRWSLVKSTPVPGADGKPGMVVNIM